MAGNINIKSKRRIASEINIVPLVDVMLVLLLLLMALTPMLVGGVNVDLPRSGAGAIQQNQEPLIVSIDKFGNIFIMDTMVTVETLIPKLKAIAAKKPDVRIAVKGDRTLRYEQIMSVVASIQNAGFTKLALITNAK